MDNDERALKEREVVLAVELLDQLLETADDGQRITIGSFEASTILALLMDKSYRVAAMSRLDDFADVGTGD